MKTVERAEIEYSRRIPGQRQNYGWAVRFDETEGSLGIQQYDEDGDSAARVLLSPKQVEALMVFYRKWHPHVG